VLEGSTDPSAGPALVAAGAAALAAASGSSKGSSSKNRFSRSAQAGLLAVKGKGLGLRAGAEVALRGSWEQHETYGWQIT
jgi:hypothetical protein